MTLDYSSRDAYGHRISNLMVQEFQSKIDANIEAETLDDDRCPI